MALVAVGIPTCRFEGTPMVYCQTPYGNHRDSTARKAFWIYSQERAFLGVFSPHLPCEMAEANFCRVAQEPNRNRKPEPSEPFFPEPKAEPEPPEPFSRNRNRNRNRPFLLNCTETHRKKKKPSLQRNRQNRKPEPLEPFHLKTVAEPNRTGAEANFWRFQWFSPKFLSIFN